MATHGLRPRLTMLSDEDRHKLHTAALKILDEIGMRVQHAEARRLLAEGGARLDGEVVFIPADMVARAIASAPSRVELFDRGGEPVMQLGGDNVYFGTGSDLLYAVDAETHARRECSLDDVRRAARLVDALDNLDFVMSMAHPREAPEGWPYAESFRAMVESTTKPVVFTADRREDLLEICALAAAVRGGVEEHAARPFIVQYAEPISPLSHPEASLDKVLRCAERGVPLIYSPAPMAGATAPITMAGHVALGLAECLTGLVVHQLAREGAPFIFGMGPAVLDMATAQSSYNAPEYYLSYAAMIEMTKHYDRPSWGYAGTSDSQVPDGQATLEAGLITFLSSALCANLNHDVGYLDFGVTGSLEMVVIMDELVSQLRRFFQGVPVDDDSLGLDAIREVGPGGHFLEHTHTFEHFRAGQWRPRLFNRLGRQEWEAAGALTLVQRASKRVEELLDAHRPSPLDDEVTRAFAEIVARRTD